MKCVSYFEDRGCHKGSISNTNTYVRIGVEKVSNKFVFIL